MSRGVLSRGGDTGGPVSTISAGRQAWIIAMGHRAPMPAVSSSSSTEPVAERRRAAFAGGAIRAFRVRS